MLASDHKNTVFSEVRKDGRQDVAYTAYGHSAPDGSLRYNGERCEAQTGWYLLGNGYRAYNTGLMRFHSPDSLSPFGEGGLNSYIYCGGNPIDLFDPTGRIAVFGWLSRLGSWLSKAFSTGGTKAAGSARSSLSSLEMTMFEPSNVGRTASKVATAGRTASKAAKSSTPSALKGSVVDGNVKGGLFEGLKRGAIKPERIKVTDEKLAQRAPVKGAKLGDALENPQSGAQRIQSRLKKGLLKDDVQTEVSNVRGPKSQRAEATKSIGGNVY